MGKKSGVKRKEHTGDEGGSYSAKYIPLDLVDEIVYDSPECNRTASLYSQTDVHKCMTDFLLEMLPDCGFVEDKYWHMWRLACTVVASAIGTYTVLFFKFPKDREYVLLMVILFFIIAGIVAAIDQWGIGPDNVYTLKDKNGRMIKCGLRLDEFSSEVVWTFKGGRTKATNVKRCLSNYFDTEGFLVVENMFDDFCQFLEEHCGHVPIVWESRADYNLEDSRKKK